MKEVEPSKTTEVGGGLPIRYLEELPWPVDLPATLPVDYNPAPPDPK